MDEYKIKQTIAANIAAYRREKDMTQAELAAALNYSDKSISKWERAEGVPDIYVLTQIAELFGVTLNDLAYDHSIPTDPTDDVLDEKPAEAVETVKEKKPSIFSYVHNRVIVAILSGSIVWLVAAIVFFFLRVFLPDFERCWLVFLYATPVTFIVLTVFSGLWRSHLYQLISVSGIIWSSAASVVLSVPGGKLVSFYLVALVLQVMTALWYAMKIWNTRLRMAAQESDQPEAKNDEYEQNVTQQ